jgi:glycosyltransferase involved in cell wall biosynthesis
MKINIVLSHALPFPPTKGGGIEKINYSLAKSLLKSGHSVTVYSRYEKDLSFNEIDRNGIKHVRTKAFDWTGSNLVNAFNSLRWCLNLYNKIEPADITIFNSLFAFIFTKKNGIGIIANSIQRTPDWKLFFYKYFDRNYCTCEAVRQQVLKLPFRLKDTSLLYNCVEIPETSPVVKKDYSEGFNFFYFGRIKRDKGLMELIEGFIKSRNLFPQNKLFIRGPYTYKEGADGKFYNLLEQKVNENDLNNSIKFFPPAYDKKELKNFIESNDVACFTSLSGEGFPSAVLEAMSFYKPVIVSDFGPMAETIEHLKSGYITKTGNSENICEAIIYFSENPSLIKTMGLNARERVKNNFSNDAVAKSLIKDIKQFKEKRN